MDSNYRDEALVKLVDNGVSASNMEIWIAGYIAGRYEVEKTISQLLNLIPGDTIPVNELWMKNKDGTTTRIINIG